MGAGNSNCGCCMFGVILDDDWDGCDCCIICLPKGQCALCGTRKDTSPFADDSASTELVCCRWYPKSPPHRSTMSRG